MATIKGGDRVEAYLRDLASKLDRPATLKVGFLAGATYPKGTPVPLIAAFNEFGTGRAPPRPFFRNMIAAKSHEWGPAAAGLLKASGYDVKYTLDALGLGITGQLQKSIRDLWTPPLAPSTIARKGHDKPLVDTGHMLNSASYQVTIR